MVLVKFFTCTRRRDLIAVLLSCHLLVLTRCTVSAFGGLFGRTASSIRAAAVNDSADNNGVPLVQITQSSTILGIQQKDASDDAESSQKRRYVTIQVQLGYSVKASTNTNDNSLQGLAWVLPVPVTPTRIHLGSALLFHNLRNQTQPTFALNVQNAAQALDAKGASDAHLNEFMDETSTSQQHSNNWTYCTEAMLQEHCYTDVLRSPDISSLLMTTDSKSFPIPNDTGKVNDAESLPLPSSTGVAGYFDYTILQDSHDVMGWLQELGYHINNDEGNSDDSNDRSLSSILQTHESHNPQMVFLAIQFKHTTPGDNRTTTTSSMTHPIMIQYDLQPLSHTEASTSSFDKESNLMYGQELPFVHRLPFQLSAFTAEPNATFDVHVLTDDSENVEYNQNDNADSSMSTPRAIPINYLDVEMDDAFVDWMGCYPYPDDNSSNHRDMMKCLQEDYRSRWYHVTRTIHPQSLITEYAGALRDVYTPMTVPEGLTVILAASTSWLGFLTNLQDAGIPPVPSVLEIIDRYVPRSTFELLDSNNDDIGSRQQDATAWLTAQACRYLDHIYDAPHIRGGTENVSKIMPTLEDCYNLYTPPSPDWKFNAQGLAEELEQRVFQPSRIANEWIQGLSSLTRMFGRLDSAAVTSRIGGNATLMDPHFVLMKKGVHHQGNQERAAAHHAATAAPVCNSFTGEPHAWELTLSSTSASADDEKGRVWQLGRYDCQFSSWEANRESDFPVLVMSGSDSPEQHFPAKRSMASSLHAWGLNGDDDDNDNDGVTVHRDAQTGGFAAKDINRAVQFGNALLKDLLVLQAAGSKGEQNNNQANNVENPNSNGPEDGEKDRPMGFDEDGSWNSKSGSTPQRQVGRIFVSSVVLMLAMT